MRYMGWWWKTAARVRWRGNHLGRATDLYSKANDCDTGFIEALSAGEHTLTRLRQIKMMS
ncbi:hypothetical protein D083_4273 [Dickeya solani RNS 08.23.3.1.A]|nr:hypothetical protein D083_4273 [Dickeya solani RNS 08.23.3.1.A]